jgi:hypothetical protein
MYNETAVSAIQVRTKGVKSVHEICYIKNAYTTCFYVQYFITLLILS